MVPGSRLGPDHPRLSISHVVQHPDTQIVKKSFLEDINNLLNSGDVPELGLTRLLWWGGGIRCFVGVNLYARRMGQPTQRATNYTAKSNIDTAQIFLHANGQRPKRAMIRQRSRRRQRRGEPHTEHVLGVLLAKSLYVHCWP